MWRRPLLVWEEELFISLKEDLEGHRSVNHRIDGFGIWRRRGFFSVKSCYVKSERLLVGEEEWNIE